MNFHGKSVQPPAALKSQRQLPALAHQHFSDGNPIRSIASTALLAPHRVTRRPNNHTASSDRPHQPRKIACGHRIFVFFTLPSNWTLQYTQLLAVPKKQARHPMPHKRHACPK